MKYFLSLMILIFIATNTNAQRILPGYLHGYDGSTMFCDYFIKGNEAPVKVTWMNNMRKKLMKLTSDHPNLGAKFYDLDYSNPYQVIKWYNSN